MQQLFSLTRISSNNEYEYKASVTDIFFSSLEKAVARLEWENENGLEPYGLCECSYDLVVIEEAQLDSNDPDFFFQKWFELQKQEDGGYLWKEIDCPEKYKRTVCFHSIGQ